MYFCTVVNVLFHIARRLTFHADAQTGRRSPAVPIAVIGVAIAVVVMEWTLGVVSGFRTQITDKVLATQAPITVSPPYDYNSGQLAATLDFDSRLDSIIHKTLPGAETSLAITYPGVLKTPDDFLAIVLQASQRGSDQDAMRANVVSGKWPEQEDNVIVISDATARRLALEVGKKVDVCFFVDGGVKVRRPRIAAIYDNHFGEKDQLNAYVPLSWLQDVMNLPLTRGTRVDVYPRQRDTELYPTLAGCLQGDIISAASEGELPTVYPVDEVKHKSQMFFNWLQLLDTNVTVIFILMGVVAGFMLITAMFILILERVATIGLLRTLGMTTGRVAAIFVWMAQRLVLRGLIWGNLIGIGTLLLQKYTALIPLDADTYYLSAVPVDIVWWQFVMLNVSVIVMAWLVLILPARIVSSVKPAVTLRFE